MIGALIALDPQVTMMQKHLLAEKQLSQGLSHPMDLAWKHLLLRKARPMSMNRLAWPGKPQCQACPGAG